MAKLNEKKPSERFGAWDHTAVGVLLDELHAFCLTLQRAQPPSAGEALDGGAKCHHCGHFELSAKRARDNYAHCPSCGRHTVWETPSAGGSGGDALEMLRAAGNSSNYETVGRIISSLEAERARVATDMHRINENCERKLTAEQRAHEKAQRELVRAHTRQEEIIAQLQRELGERTRERADALEAFRAACLGPSDGSVSLHALTCRLVATRNELQVALDSANATGEELLRQRDEAREICVTVTADRDRLQAELDKVLRVDVVKLQGELASVQHTVRENELLLRAALVERNRYMSEAASLRAQSSDGLRESMVSMLSELGSHELFTVRELKDLLAAHPAPAEVSGEEAVVKCGRTRKQLHDDDNDDAVRLFDEFSALRARVEKAVGIATKAIQWGEGEATYRRACSEIRETLLTSDTPTPAPASAEMLAERVKAKLDGERVLGKLEEWHLGYNCALRDTGRIVTEELAALKGGE